MNRHLHIVLTDLGFDRAADGRRVGGSCSPAWGPDADRHFKLLIYFAVEGLLLDAYSYPASSKPSIPTQVETWTKDQWEAAQKEWAKDTKKWADCRMQSSKERLEGRKSWPFLYKCMTS